MMLVWLVKRRSIGAIVPAPTYSFLNEGEPQAVELIVKSGSEQGTRQPGKIARVYAAGSQRILAEIDSPRLLLMRRTGLVLMGIERHRDHQALVGCVQTWVCTFAPPFDALEQRVSPQMAVGVAIHRSRVLETGNTGYIEVNQMHVPELRRYATVASFIADSSGCEAMRLLDADLSWMGKDRFALEGIYRKSAYREQPEALYEGGWLSFYQEKREAMDNRRYASSKSQR
ncbi:hypothetical protein GTP58_28505 [Duganella sp. CY15W]|uniref:hypothetical protein n=1 Tax=Duganella sp. CY15W TaxID=2692172 RepID=UPI00136ECBB2|nr:hypothetical protein [Duganella sp. CY15W]MYM32279.1 hypothetical protein [Duganella sp. CY15W]